jgi:hypothetical protein
MPTNTLQFLLNFCLPSKHISENLATEKDERMSTPQVKCEFQVGSEVQNCLLSRQHGLGLLERITK